MSNYEISKSSLLSLKAEILRKQQDLTKAKNENDEKIKSIKKKTPLELKNKGVDERSRTDLDEEEQDLLKLSKSKLEAKAKLYDKLSRESGQSEDIGRRFLVRFDKKNRIGENPLSDSEQEPDLPVESEKEKHFSDEYDEAVDPSEEWVEYTDCLGRSRKCLRKDLEYLKSKDAKLERNKVTSEPLEKSANSSGLSDDINNEETKKINNHDTQSQISTEESELISGDMKREMLRQQWKQEEAELRDKTDIHYQNVLFNEARQHGVGYYGFSKDEEERAKQQEALKKLREETEQQQKRAQELKALREKQMAARMKAARNRRRARLGLPPEEDEPTPPETDQKSEEEENTTQEEQRAAAEEAEKLLIEARKRHVRPWDIGKEGVSEHYEMTQEEWNEKQRQERPAEFAPPQNYSKREFSGMQSLDCDIEDVDKSLKFSTRNIKNVDRRKPNMINNNKLSKGRKNQSLFSKPDSYKKDEAKNNYLSNSDNNDRLLKDYIKSQDLSSVASPAPLRGLNPYKNNEYQPTEPTSDTDDDDDNLLRDYKKMQASVTASMDPIPIVNELEETDFDDKLLDDYKRSMQSFSDESEDLDTGENLRKRGVEVAPPPTYEYYGPGEGKRTRTSLSQVNIAESIEAGLRFLRKRADRIGRHCVDEI